VDDIRLLFKPLSYLECPARYAIARPGGTRPSPPQALNFVKFMRHPSFRPTVQVEILPWQLGKTGKREGTQTTIASQVTRHLRCISDAARDPLRSYSHYVALHLRCVPRSESLTSVPFHFSSDPLSYITHYSKSRTGFA
jgi:hypothetical protein